MGFAKLLKTTWHRSAKKRHLIPFFLTFANALLGFLAIVQTVEGNYTTALYCLVLAALMDLLDGRLARALGTASTLGGELDSLADAISFCVAPCIILYAWYPGTVGYTGLMALGLYVGAGIFRLARFNSTSQSHYAYFVGLPTPIAACCMISLMLSYHWMSQHAINFIFYKRIPFLIITSIALLMISSIPFPNFKKSTRRYSWIYRTLFMGIWCCVIAAAYYGYPLPLLMCTLYIMASVGHWLYTTKVS